MAQFLHKNVFIYWENVFIYCENVFIFWENVFIIVGNPVKYILKRPITVNPVLNTESN